MTTFCANVRWFLLTADLLFLILGFFFVEELQMSVFTVRFKLVGWDKLSFESMQLSTVHQKHANVITSNTLSFKLLQMGYSNIVVIHEFSVNTDVQLNWNCKISKSQWWNKCKILDGMIKDFLWKSSSSGMTGPSVYSIICLRWR